MKKMFIICLVFINIQVFAQSSLKFSLWGGTFSDPNLSGLYGYDSIYVAVDQNYPFLAGLQIEFALNPTWAIISGYHYNYRYLKISVFSESVGEIFGGVRMHTSEIPLLLKFNHSFQKLNELKLYGQAGMSFDYMYVPIKAFGKYRTDDYLSIRETWGSFYVLNLPLALIPSTVAEIGISTNLGKAGDVEVGFQWHRQIPAQLGNQIIYYHLYGSGTPTNHSYEYFIRSNYTSFTLHYIFPWEMRFKGKKNHHSD